MRFPDDVQVVYIGIHGILSHRTEMTMNDGSFYVCLDDFLEMFWLKNFIECNYGIDTFTST